MQILQAGKEKMEFFLFRSIFVSQKIYELGALSL